MTSIFYHTQDSFAEMMFAQLCKGKLHAKSLYAHFMRWGSLDGFSVESQAKELVASMIELIDFTLPSYHIAHMEDGTIKFILTLEDGLECESVFIPMRSRSTLCISSQIGCQRGCTFCETGRMGLLRHLKVEEIVAQVFIARHALERKFDNIVFMGMGEPLDNFDSVVHAIGVLTDPAGLKIGPSRITVSTSGVVDQIDAFADQVDPAVNLAVSVNAPNDEIRQKIMPVNRKWNMQALRGAMERFCAHPRREIFAEYVLLEGINDSIESADELATYLRGLRVKVNLIPYNPQSKDRFAPPPQQVIDAFASRMKMHGFLTLVRGTKGQKIMAACGQLGNLQLRRKMVRMANLSTRSKNHDR